jgi:hypothetical protein
MQSLAARFYLPHIASASTFADVGLGYEWLTQNLVDSGARSTRAYHGPLLLSSHAAAPFRIGDHWTLGPIIGASLGTFTSYSLDSGAISSSGSVPSRAFHLWLSLGVRLAVAL